MTFITNPKTVQTREHAQEIVDQYDNFLFDCDGVIWLAEALIPGILETVLYLQQQNKGIAFVTNNSSKSRDDYVKKFKNLGFVGVTKDIIFPTSYSAAASLDEVFGVKPGSKIWVLGDNGIEQELRELNYVPVGGTDKNLDVAFNENDSLLQVDSEVKAVVVGSTKEFNYMRIASTLQYLLHDNKKIPFIGANIDRTYPGPHGLILPAGGSVVNYMEYTSGRKHTDVGKPSGKFLESILRHTGFDKSKTLMVGDTMYTDIKFGNDGQLGNGKGSLLVLTGGTKAQDLEHLLQNPDEYENGSSMIPLYVIESFGDLYGLLRNN